MGHAIFEKYAIDPDHHQFFLFWSTVNGDSFTRG